MKCVLCEKVLRGAGAMLLGKPCACKACIETYDKLLEAQKAGDPEAAKWVEFVEKAVDEYQLPIRKDVATSAVAYAQTNWNKS